jgi:DNA invertase Pin-like site-specific DNA recombinase
MARRSRTNQSDELKTKPEQRVFQAGLYRRLSVEADGDNEEYNSIGNQQKLAEDFILRTPFLHIKKVYTDNGYTGMNYQRPGFQEMMQDLYAGMIDCVIVKDISRLGRHFILTSEMVEKTFPSMGVRLICINDEYDSIDPNADSASLLFQIKMVMNDNYAKDFSKKIRSSIGAKMSAGKFLPASGSIPYGYIRNPEKGTFDIDEETAPVVRRIFEMRQQGISFNGIAKALNDENIPSPGRIRFERGMTKNEKYEKVVWLRGAVKKITSDLVYTGCRIHGKVKRDRLGENKTRRSEEEWQVIENAHEPIIDKELFETVRKVNDKAVADRKKLVKRPAPADDKREVLRDKVYCGDCGSRMTATKGIGRITKKRPNSSFVYYQCNRYRDTLQTDCKSHYIRQGAIVAALQNCLNEQLKIALDYEAYMECVRKMPKVAGYQRNAANAVISARTKRNGLKQKNDKLFSDFCDGLLEKSEYEYMKSRLNMQYLQAEHDYNAALQTEKELESIDRTGSTWMNMLKERGNFDNIDKSLVDELVEKIIVYDNRKIQIILKFDNPFPQIKDYVRRVEEYEAAG